MNMRYVLVAAGLAAALTTAPATADCPQSKLKLLPADAPVGLACSTFGPNGDRFEMRVYLTNQGKAQTTALKLQANMFDAFGSLVRTWQFDEPMGLQPGTANYDNAVYGEHLLPAIQAVDHIDLYVLGVAYADGTNWTTPVKPDVGPTPAPEDHFRRL